MWSHLGGSEAKILTNTHDLHECVCPCTHTHAYFRLDHPEFDILGNLLILRV